MRADVVAAGRELTDAALRGEVAAALAALERHRVLYAHRRGPYAVTRWSAETTAAENASMRAFTNEAKELGPRQF